MRHIQVPLLPAVARYTASLLLNREQRNKVYQLATLLLISMGGRETFAAGKQKIVNFNLPTTIIC